MRILFTGHEGYIGAVARPIFRSAGHEVIGLDTHLFAGCDFGVPVPPIPDARKDIRHPTKADLEGLDALVHRAALSNDPLGNLDLTSLTASITEPRYGSRNSPKRVGVKRFVFSSSCATYGVASDAWMRQVRRTMASPRSG